MEFEKRAETVKAIQFDGSYDSAREIYKMLDDLASRRGYLRQTQLKLQTSVSRADAEGDPVLEITRHQVDGEPIVHYVYVGDWAVVMPDGALECMLDRNFQSQYQPKES